MKNSMFPINRTAAQSTHEFCYCSVGF